MHRLHRAAKRLIAMSAIALMSATTALTTHATAQTTGCRVHWTHSAGTWVEVHATCPRPVRAHVQARHPAPHTAVSPGASYTEVAWITWYAATGYPMANGLYPSDGWAACSYDMPLGTRVYVPGVGMLTCGDRPGVGLANHIDVYGYHPGLGSDYRTITVYR